MTQTNHTRLFQAGVLTLAVLSSIVFFHWFVTSPTPVAMAKDEFPAFVQILFMANKADTAYNWYLQLTLGLIATTGIAASALASYIALKAAPTKAIRELALALVFCSIAVAYFFFVTTHEIYRQSLGWSWGEGWRLFLDVLFYSLDLFAPLLLICFFASYPRVVTPDQMEKHYREIASAEREKIDNSWRKYLFANRFAGYIMNTQPHIQQSNLHRFWASRTSFLCAILVALLCATADHFGRSIFGASGSGSQSKLAGVLRFVLPLLLVLTIWFGGMGNAFEKLKYHHRNGIPEDRTKIEWIYATMLVAGILAVTVAPLWWTVSIIWIIPALEARGIFPPGALLFLGPTIVSLELLIFAFVVALAMSIFYRGAVDPRLAARKLTVFGVIGLLVAFLFVLVERTVALKIVAYFNLSPDTGALIAGASVAATVAPIKNHAEKAINAFVGRFLPLDSMIEGERKTIAVALSDLSGYTELSSRDEKQALLMAALLQRQAQKITAAHGGRVVKAMGDAILFAFDDAPAAVKALTVLHRDFGMAAEQVGLIPLPVHSGVHLGEVTIAHDGDIYGQTVNIAARIQNAAAPGQIVVSDTFAEAAGGAGYRDLGPRQFKNVPQPVTCLELTMQSVLPSAAATA